LAVDTRSRRRTGAPDAFTPARRTVWTSTSSREATSIWFAWSRHEEAIRGPIEPGAPADLAIL
jgi:hypothetical protein